MPGFKSALARRHRVGALAREIPHWDIAQGVCFTRARRGPVMEIGLELRPASPLFASAELLENAWYAMKSVLQLGVPLRERGRLILEVVPADGDVLRRYAAVEPSSIALVNALGDSTLQHYERERLGGRVLEWRAYFTCTVSLPERRPNGVIFSPGELAAALERAHARRARLLNLLRTAGFDPRAMDTQEVFALAYRYFNPSHTPASAPRFLSHDDRPGYIPSEELRRNPTVYSRTLREQLACSVVDNMDPNQLLVGDRLVSAVAFRDVPTSTEPNCIRHLMNSLSSFEAARAGRQFYLVEDFVHQPFGPRLRGLQQVHERLNASAEGGEGRRGNPQAGAQARQLHHAIEEVTESGDHFYTTSVTLIMMGRTRDDLEALKEAAINAFARYPGSEPVYGPYQTRFQYFACAPFGGGVGEYAFEPVESDAVNLMPVSLPWRGATQPRMLVRTRAGTLASLDPFSESTLNWNAAIVSGSGGGKTFLMQKITAALVRHGARIAIVDKKEDYQSFLNAIKESSGDEDLVATIEFDPSSGVRYNMFELPTGTKEPDEAKRRSIKAQLRCLILPSPDPVQAATESAIIDECVSRAYRQRGDRTVLSDFYGVTQTINAMGGKDLDEDAIRLARSLGVRLRSFVGERSTYGPFLDGPSNINVGARIVYFKTSGLESHPDLLALANLMISDIVWAMARGDPETFKLAVLEEFWSMLKTPEAKAMAEEFYRLARSYRLAMYAITQDSNDLEEVPGLIASCCYYWVGRQETEKQAEQVARLLDLPLSAKDDLKRLGREQHRFVEWMHFVREGEERTGDILRIDSTPLERALFGSNATDKARRARYIARHGSILRAAQAMVEDGL
jgi:conjugal transfer ATP-binding protein TraC